MAKRQPHEPRLAGCYGRTAKRWPSRWFAVAGGAAVEFRTGPASSCRMGDGHVVPGGRQRPRSGEMEAPGQWAEVAIGPRESWRNFRGDAPAACHENVRPASVSLRFAPVHDPLLSSSNLRGIIVVFRDRFRRGGPISRRHLCARWSG